MKPIEYCLDTILKNLRESYADDKRPPLKYSEHEIDFDAPLKRHEFYKGLIDILMEDKYAEFLKGSKRQKESGPELDDYKENTIITVKGIYFIESGGYQKQSQENQKENKRLQDIEITTLGISRRSVEMQRQGVAIQRTLRCLTIVLAIAALIPAIYYILLIIQVVYSYYHQHG